MSFRSKNVNLYLSILPLSFFYFLSFPSSLSPSRINVCVCVLICSLMTVNLYLSMASNTEPLTPFPLRTKGQTNTNLFLSMYLCPSLSLSQSLLLPYFLFLSHILSHTHALDVHERAESLISKGDSRKNTHACLYLGIIMILCR